MKTLFPLSAMVTTDPAKAMEDMAVLGTGMFFLPTPGPEMSTVSETLAKMRREIMAAMLMPAEMMAGPSYGRGQPLPGPLERPAPAALGPTLPS